MSYFIVGIDGTFEEGITEVNNGISQGLIFYGYDGHNVYDFINLQDVLVTENYLNTDGFVLNADPNLNDYRQEGIMIKNFSANVTISNAGSFSVTGLDNILKLENCDGAINITTDEYGRNAFGITSSSDDHLGSSYSSLEFDNMTISLNIFSEYTAYGVLAYSVASADSSITSADSSNIIKLGNITALITVKAIVENAYGISLDTKVGALYDSQRGSSCNSLTIGNITSDITVIAGGEAIGIQMNADAVRNLHAQNSLTIGNIASKFIVKGGTFCNCNFD